jgi:adenylate cyclase
VGGQFDLADEGYERAAVLLESTTNDPGPVAAFYRSPYLPSSGLNLWLLGYPDRGVNRMKSAVAFASQSGSKAALLIALSLQSVLHGPYLCEFEHARESAEALLSLATALGDAVRCATSETLLGWLQGETGDLEGGSARMRRGLSAVRSMGSTGGIPYFLALTTTVLGRTGQFDEAFRAINEALKIVERTGDRSGEAEVHRLKGELLLAQNTSNAAQAGRCFHTAIEIARLQHGKSWELRAATSLARLLRDTNRRDEARAMLSEIYNWFTEGFHTADLKDAKALLDELSA